MLRASPRRPDASATSYVVVRGSRGLGGGRDGEDGAAGRAATDAGTDAEAGDRRAAALCCSRHTRSRRNRLRRANSTVSTERHAQNVEVVLEMGDRLREPVQPPYDELLIDPTGVHVLDQGGRCEGAFRQVTGDAIGSGPPAHVQRDPWLHSGSVSHLFLPGVLGQAQSFCPLAPCSRQQALKSVQVS